MEVLEIKQHITAKYARKISDYIELIKYFMWRDYRPSRQPAHSTRQTTIATCRHLVKREICQNVCTGRRRARKEAEIAQEFHKVLRLFYFDT